MHLSLEVECFSLVLKVRTEIVGWDLLVAVLVIWIGFGGLPARPPGALNQPHG